MHARSVRDAAAPQIHIERITRAMGSPWCAPVALGLIAIWIVFDWHQVGILELFITVFSMLLSIFIVTTERRLGELADRRELVTLQLVVFAEQKITKVIELLEAMRHDDPLLPDRSDREAARMAQVTDVEEVIEALDEMPADARPSAPT